MNTKRISIIFIMMITLIAVPMAWSNGQQEAAPAASGEAVESAPDFPTDSIDFLIPFGAGGSADLVGRAIASAAEASLGEAVVPINKPGAGGGIMYTELEKSKNDGYTVGWNSTSVVTATNIGNVPFGYDAFDHLCRIGYTSMPIAVKADSPWNTIEELAAYAKANPGKIKIGNAGTGSGTHLTAVLFENAAGIKVVHVPLGAKRRVPSLLGGEVEAICVPLPEAAPQADAGAIKILAVSTEERHPAYPEIPTLMEKGWDVNMPLFRGISMPKGTDPAVLKTLEEAFEAASQNEEFNKVADMKGFIVDFMGHDEFEAYLAEQNMLAKAALKTAGLIQ
ncbi:MAG: tripartite tricarboxylate transporter substrate binding protein [Spirochaetales bacterium]|uniref:Tripartite tricarboxylate transporter substrate binding protein n=1 Tax=Candidatus Thalassospirochaeta sargassi TaxID=3119039 RepID=A0AAJ1IE84_9SPIO|nr:tripartite tricarboxylate transporter substrate binding protein [Spirochaetales bacterium]